MSTNILVNGGDNEIPKHTKLPDCQSLRLVWNYTQKDVLCIIDWSCEEPVLKSKEKTQYLNQLDQFFSLVRPVDFNLMF